MLAVHLPHGMSDVLRCLHCIFSAQAGTQLFAVVIFGTRDLLDEADDAFASSEQGRQLCFVTPQPHSDCVVLLSSPVQCLAAGQVPICLQAQDRRGAVNFWLEMSDPILREDDVREALGQDWQEGSSIFVANRRGLLLPGDSCEVFPGCLVHVVPPRLPPAPRVALANKLSAEPPALRDVTQMRFPADEVCSHVYAVLQLLEPASRVQFSPPLGGGTADLDRVLLSHALSTWRPYTIVWPPERITDFMLRGRPMCLACGAYPSNLHARVPVIVDGRHVGRHLRLYASLQGTMSLAAFLDTIGMFDPDHSLLHVTGSASFDPQQRTIRVASGDIVVPSFRTEIDGNEQGLSTVRGPVTVILGEAR